MAEAAELLENGEHLLNDADGKRIERLHGNRVTLIDSLGMKRIFITSLTHFCAVEIEAVDHLAWTFLTSLTSTLQEFGGTAKLFH